MKNNKLIFMGLLVGCLVFCLMSCKYSGEKGKEKEIYVYRVPVQADDGWETAHAADENIDQFKLTAMMNEYFGITSQDVHAILIVKNKRLVFEEYFAGHDYGGGAPYYRGAWTEFNRFTLHCMHSVTKSFTSAMMGIAIDKGFISGVDEKMFSYFPEYSHLMDSEKEKITLEHLLAMSSGLEWNEGDVALSDDNNDLTRMIRSSDPIGFILGKPVVHEPGAYYYYSGGDTNIVGDMIRRSTGLNVDLLSREYLFPQLGITDFSWLYFPLAEGIVYCSGDIYLRPRDMAKFGQLFLNGGTWKGERIISEEWINISTSPYIATPEGVRHSDAYGYQWWLFTYNIQEQEIFSYSARGWGGQYIIVLPGLNVVVVFTGGNYATYPPCHHLMATYILPAIL